MNNNSEIMLKENKKIKKEISKLKKISWNYIEFKEDEDSNIEILLNVSNIKWIASTKSFIKKLFKILNIYNNIYQIILWEYKNNLKKENVIKIKNNFSNLYNFFLDLIYLIKLQEAEYKGSLSFIKFLSDEWINKILEKNIDNL